MKVFYILTLTLFNVLGINAQNKEFLSAESCPFKLGEPTAVTKAEDKFIAAKLSPDDKKLMVTKARYWGIYIIDLESNNQLTNVTDEEKVGYDSEWTQSGDAILFKSKQSGKTYKLVNYNLKQKTISPAKQLRSGVQGINNQKEITVEFNLKRRIVEATDGTKTWDITKLEGENTVFYRFVISPDKTKVLVHRNNGNMYIYALDGSGLLFNLGHGLCQSWTPDNKYLVYFISHDNGNYTTESDIYVSSVDGKKKWKLTDTPLPRVCNAWQRDNGTIAAKKQEKPCECSRVMKKFLIVIFFVINSCNINNRLGKGIVSFFYPIVLTQKSMTIFLEESTNYLYNLHSVESGEEIFIYSLYASFIGSQDTFKLVSDSLIVKKENDTVYLVDGILDHYTSQLKSDTFNVIVNCKYELGYLNDSIINCICGNYIIEKLNVNLVDDYKPCSIFKPPDARSLLK